MCVTIFFVARVTNLCVYAYGPVTTTIRVVNTTFGEYYHCFLMSGKIRTKPTQVPLDKQEYRQKTIVTAKLDEREKNP